MTTYDLVVIGAGSAGTAAAVKANELQARTLLINSGLPLGGTCPNVGCVPSKAMLWAAENLHSATLGHPGIRLNAGRVDYAEVVDATERLVRKIRKTRYERVVHGLEHVTVLEGRARFVGQRQLDIDGQRVGADHILIATGSTATVPEVPGLVDSGYITHIEALSRRQLPGSLAIIGGGPLGLEFSQVFARFGVRVTLLQRAANVLPVAEPLLTDRLLEILEGEGIRILTEAHLTGVSRQGSEKVVRFTVNGEESEVRVEEVMLAAGKTANTAGLGLEAVGVETTERAAIRVGPTLRTSVEGLWAAGDVAALPNRIETSAAREGSYAVSNALTGSAMLLDYHELPYTVFTDPQLAAVGFTESEGDRAFGSCKCRAVYFTSLPKAQIIDRREGLIKMAIHPTEGTVLGVHILSPNAGDLIAQAATLIHEKARVEDVASSLPVFPTLSEALKYVAIAFTRSVDDMPCCI